MAQSVLALEIYEPGTPRAHELLAAIAAKLGLDYINVDSDQRHVMLGLSMEWSAAFELAEQALDEAGDEGRMVVRPLTPP